MIRIVGTTKDKSLIGIDRNANLLIVSSGLLNRSEGRALRFSHAIFALLVLLEDAASLARDRLDGNVSRRALLVRDDQRGVGEKA